MTPERILVALDDAPAALASARFAVSLAARLGARVRFVHVVTDGDVAKALDPRQRDAGLQTRRQQAGESLVAHALGLAADAGAESDGGLVGGEPAPALLDAARDWRADLIVLGHSDRTGPGAFPLGRVTRHVLEFSECPVLVVPQSPDPRLGDSPRRW